MSTDPQLEARLWEARAAVYGHLARTGRAPTPEQMAETLGVEDAQSEALFRLMQERHLVLLGPGDRSIHMAFPFSGIPTGFKALVGDVEYYANCAWDGLGIPAALHASDADIEIQDPMGGEPFRIAVRNGQLADGEVVARGVVHFAVPFAHWYDDLVAT